MSSSITYFTLLDSRSLGVKRKIHSMTRALAKVYGLYGYTKFYDTSLCSIFKLFRDILKCESKLIVLRSSILLSPAFFLLILLKRITGHKIIVDVPTPRVVVLKEIYNSNVFAPVKFLKIVFILFLSNLQLYPSNLTLFNGRESKYFKFLLAHKVVYFFNGVDAKEYCSVISIKEKLSKEKIDVTGDNNIVNIIAVGQLAIWHGFDRVIRALGALEDFDRNRFCLTIVGDGDEYNNLRALVSDLNLSSHVSFVGKKSGSELDSLLANSDLGVASLGLHRIGMVYSSTLKQREYCAAGLPFIYSTYDPDFIDCDFCLQVEEGEDIQSIARTLLSFESTDFCFRSINRYAKNNLSYESKIRKLILPRVRV